MSDLKVVKDGDAILTVHWNKPEGSNYTKFHVYKQAYSRDNNLVESVVYNESKENYSVALKPSIPGEIYRVNVAAENAFGNSSRILYFRTGRLYVV